MNLWIPPLLAPSVLRKESAASYNARDAPRFIGYGTCAYAASGIIILNMGVVRHVMYMYITFMVIPYYGHGINNYVNLFMIAIVSADGHIYNHVDFILTYNVLVVYITCICTCECMSTIVRLIIGLPNG